MTWVVGASSLLGYGVMVSDVRISFSDGTQSDMLRKVYPIGRWMLGGFAGSVRIGMALLEDLRRTVAAMSPRHVPDNREFHFNPVAVAQVWAPRAAEIFSRMPANERELGSQIMLVGVADTPPDRPLPPNARQLPFVHIIKFSWPSFEPEPAGERWTARHIGSGAGIERFVAAIGDLFSLESGAHNAEMAAGGFASLLGHAVARLVRDQPVDGVSAHANIDACYLGGMSRGNNDERIYARDGSVIHFEMPPLAESYEEFLRMCDERGKAATGAIC